ncbi:hypothetical protein [Dongia sp.]|uniref:hypothetical protein n=1 Tax=Dongia sp. TaxID=1977262 RepID=UPI0035B1A350
MPNLEAVLKAKKTAARVKSKRVQRAQRPAQKKTRHTDLAAQDRLIPPPDCVVVRMYRIGHGDCFLLAFASDQSDGPVYILIDCGYKPGSSAFIGTTAREVTASIRAATGGHVHVVVITHEHQDHVNGFTKENFKDVTFGEAWFAWTEDEDDKLANSLRERFNDRLAALIGARNRLSASGDSTTKIDDFLAFELGGDEESLRSRDISLAAMPGVSQNKRALALVRELSGGRCKYLRPHGTAAKVEGTSNLRVFTLGPPRDEALLRSLNPVGQEGFHKLSAGSPESYFFAAVADGTKSGQVAPFAPRYCMEWNMALRAKGKGAFWREHYGTSKPNLQAPPEETEDDAQWRRIDQDWLYSADQLALDMNSDTNNGSLVLAFELTPGGKVLLFAADAQRGNWASWAKGEWKDGDRSVSCRDLLGRTVLYKVGHHGSHNATLKGELEDEYANLSWMGTGEASREFSTMITAVRPWAETQKGWDHPLKAIKDALLEKAGGRVFQSDTDFSQMKATNHQADWAAFRSRVTGHHLYLDYVVQY